MYTDLLARIKNAQAVNKPSLKVPFSNMDLDVLNVLAKEGFVESVEKKGRMPKRIIDIKLKYENNRPGIEGSKLISKPSRRLYTGYKDLRQVRQGYGISVISTPEGIMSNREARKKKVGGQILFEIW
ncbi:MAG: 30S ribosomal protein S8 [bacterium]|nr:30S ribosomal protein S8 [bacterium]